MVKNSVSVHIIEEILGLKLRFQLKAELRPLEPSEIFQSVCTHTHYLFIMRPQPHSETDGQGCQRYPVETLISSRQ